MRWFLLALLLSSPALAGNKFENFSLVTQEETRSDRLYQAWEKCMTWRMYHPMEIEKHDGYPPELAVCERADRLWGESIQQKHEREREALAREIEELLR